MTTVISVENLSKIYKLGQIGSGTLTNDLKIWWSKKTGKPNPLLKIGQTDYGNQDGEILWALRDVSFQVNKGEVLGIIGRNGAGKSTLLKILSRVTAPTNGQVKIKGRIASLLEVGTGFHPELTGRENIFLNGAILGMSKQEVQQKFDEIVSFAEVEKFVDTPVKRYSSGMYVRLAFAVAAHLESEILIVDEVLAVGDVEFQKKCLGKMGDVASKEGRTVLFVSHNLTSIQNLCKNSTLLSKGKLEAISTTEKIISLYLDNENRKKTNFFRRENNTRIDNRIIELISFSVSDVKGKERNRVSYNQKCIFRIGYTIKEKRIAKHVEVALAVSDFFDKKLFTLSTEYIRTNFVNINKDGFFICMVPRIPLIPGQYKVSLWCSVNGETSDVISNAGIIEVYQDDYYGTGKLPSNKDGNFLLDFQWENE